MKKKIAVVGGGVAGTTLSLLLDEDITLFEENSSLISGPPFCHLHAGGSLYPDIPLKECISLLRESIEFLKLYPFGVDFRPTVITFPKSCKMEPKEFKKRLEKIEQEYQLLIAQDSSNKVLGDRYYRAFERDELENILNSKEQDEFTKWLKPFVKYVNLDSLKFPIFIVNEFGLNMFRVASGAELALNKKSNVDLRLNSRVVGVNRIGDKFLLSYELDDGAVLQEKFDYLINSAGFKSGEIDNMLGFSRERYVEFKAAYVTKWKDDIKFPEIIFHGKRGTEQGMAQFTPYYGGFYQLHGMSKRITLFDNGLVKSGLNSSYPKLDDKFLEIIKSGWSRDLAELRTKRAIEHFREYIPDFAKEAEVTSTPLFGAQQIPGGNPDLRAAEVSFEGDNYARCEIVKVSSAINMSRDIAKRFGLNSRYRELKVNDKEVTKLAKKIASERDYPAELGIVLNSNLV